MKIRTVEIKDLPYLEKILADGFPKTSPKKWRLLFRTFWEENPAYQPSVPRGWILEDDQHRIQGFVGSVVFRLRVNGNKGMAAAAAGWYVHPAFRGIYSLKLMRAFASQKNIDVFLSTTPSYLAEKILSKMGFSSIPLPYNRTEYWLILDGIKAFAFAIKNRLPSFPIWLNELFAAALLPSKYVFGAHYRNRRATHELDHYFDFSTCNVCDDSFSAFWEKNKWHYSTTLYRDAETLNWLYFSPPVSQNRAVIRCTIRNSDELAGYFVYDFHPSSDSNIKIMQLKDIFVPDAKRSFFLKFLTFSMQLAKKSGAAAIRIWPADHKMDQILAENIKINRKFSWPYLAKWSGAEGFERKDLTHQVFFASPIDPDRGFS